jgi:MoaA/NifB/PqqE/SkfB family radical SAM enzyme
VIDQTKPLHISAEKWPVGISADSADGIQNDAICRMPFIGMTINPDGKLVLCCTSVKHNIGHISEIEDLQEHFTHSSAMNAVRDQMKNGELPPDSCKVCITKRKAGNNTAAIDGWVKRIVPWPPTPDYRIEFLEFTASNMCNQTCVMCGSLYSSKWGDLEREAIDFGLTFRNDSPWRTGDHPIYSLSNTDMDKIWKLLPYLKRIMIKGGEPFADKRNIELIRRCNEMENPPRLGVITNFATVVPKVMKLISEYTGDITFSCSIDGLYEQYDWIRGSSFKKTIGNMDRYYEATGKKSNISISPTLYSIFNLKEAVEFFNTKDCVFEFNINHVTDPKYTSFNMLDKETLEPLLASYQSLRFNAKALRNIGHILDREPFSEKVRTQNMPYVKQWISFMNMKRGFKIEDHVPELKVYMK